MFQIFNRRYVGNKNKLMDWILPLILENCEGSSFFDVFAGTGSVTNYVLETFQSFILNDFLYSNEVIFKGFFMNDKYDMYKLFEIKDKYNNLDRQQLADNYVSENYGGKFFNEFDAKLIGYIRQDIEDLKENNSINEKEYYILLSSLLYSMDRIANTCGHYDAYIRKQNIRSEFNFELIESRDTCHKKIEIYREDSNKLVESVKADIAFIDPPYNSRQYSRFYHVLENITKWDKPELYGVAMKPKEENMSEYCRNSAPQAFEDLINKLNCNYICVTYNNTYNSKSSSSKNKITLEEIGQILSKKGETKIFEKEYKAFTAGKTELDDHKEYLFITTVRKEKKITKKDIVRSPFFYVGDKYKLMPQLKTLFPDNINNYYEPFCGGGSSFLNTKANKYYLNDIDEYVIRLHYFLQSYVNDKNKLYENLYSLIDKYGLSCSYRGIVVPDELKKQFVKTYYSRYNKNAYVKMREDYNQNRENDLLLYLLLIYGFNHMIRFNASGLFNLPVGNVDFNKNVFKALEGYLSFSEKNNLNFYNENYIEFLDSMNFQENDFIYLDPPYLISFSEYNKLWNEEKEKELYAYLDTLNDKGIKWGITNLVSHKGNVNNIFLDWSKKYNCYDINSNYISFNDNTIKESSKEVYVTNYGSSKI